MSADFRPYLFFHRLEHIVRANSFGIDIIVSRMYIKVVV